MKKLNQKGLLFAVLLVPFVSGCAVLVAAGAAGVGAGVAMSQDRRTSGTYVEDEAMRGKAVNGLAKNTGTMFMPTLRAITVMYCLLERRRRKRPRPISAIW